MSTTIEFLKAYNQPVTRGVNIGRLIGMLDEHERWIKQGVAKQLLDMVDEATLTASERSLFNSLVANLGRHEGTLTDAERALVGVAERHDDEAALAAACASIDGAMASAGPATVGAGSLRPPMPPWGQYDE